MKFRAITCLRRGLRARLRLAVSDYLRLAILLLALLPLGGFAHLGTRIYHVIDNRIRTFHELEMYEGDMTLHAIRVLEGRELYPSRNGDYIPLLYTPLYSYLHAWMMKLVDKSDRPHTIYSGRIVAVMASAGIALVILLWVLRETGNWMAALGAAGFFIGVNPLVGWWYDLARVDTAHVFFVALGSWAFLDRKSPKDWHEILKGILGGLFFSLGFFTKQTAGQIAIGLTVLAALISPLRALWGIAAGLTFGGFGLIYFNVKNTDFWYLTVTVPSNHLLMLTEGWKQEVKKDFFLPARLALSVICGWAALAVLRRRWRWVLCFIAMIWTGYFSMRGRLTIGGYLNHYIPFWFFIALLTGFAVGSFNPRGGGEKRESFIMIPIGILLALVSLAVLIVNREYFGPTLLAAGIIFAGLRYAQPRLNRSVWRSRIGFAPVAVLTLLCLNLFHDTRVRKIWPVKEGTWTADEIRYHLPQNLEGGNNFIRGIRDLDGNVWVAHANYYSYLAGRPTDISIDHVRDVAVAGQPTSPYVLAMINQRKYKYILLNNTNIDQDWGDPQVHEALHQNYEMAENWEIKYGGEALRPVDSTWQKPRALLIRKGERPQLEPLR